MSEEGRIAELERAVGRLESRAKKLEKKQREHDAFSKKFKHNARLFFQRLRSQLDFKF